MKIKSIAKEKLDIVVLIGIIALFGYFFLFCEIAECGDSFQYEMQYPMREPVYSLLLQIFQVTVGEGYMKAVGLFQNLLAIICTYWTYSRVRKIFNFNALFSVATVGALLSPHILTPLASKTHLILTNTIMTEGITISMYYIWFVMLLGILLGYYDEKKRTKAQIVSLVLGLVLAMTRGQMLLCLAVWLLVNGFVTIASDKLIKKKCITIAILVAAVLVAVFAKGQLTKVYNLAETGFYVNTVSSKPMMLANLVYVCDESDADYIEEADLREFFRDVVSRAKSDGLTMDYAPDGIIAKGRFHESGHEPLNFEYIDPAIRVVIEDRYGLTETLFLDLIIHEDMLCGDVINQLLPKVLGKYLNNYIIIATLGFVRSVAFEKSVFPVVALLLYIVAIALTVLGLTKKQTRNSAYVMILVLITICGTVLGTSLMIECITRYMIYNLPFFYIAGMNQVGSIFLGKKKN